MQWGTTLFEFFRASYFCSIQTTTSLDLDTFCTHTHCCRDSHLYSAFVAYTAFDLAGNGITHDHSIQFRTTDLHDVDLDVIFLCQLLQLFLNTIYFRTTLSYNDT